jgi:hypothetical protein
VTRGDRRTLVTTELRVGERAAAKPDKLAQANPCTFEPPAHFLYKGNTGEIETVNEKLCLLDAAATEDAKLYFASCVKVLVTQAWVIGH